MKIYNKEYLIRINKLKDIISLYNNILREIKFTFICNLYYSFQNEENLFIIIDFCLGENLDYYLKLNLFEENEAKFFIAELIFTIEYLHNLNIIYNDLKIENILIDENNHIKLSEIGLIKEINNDDDNNNNSEIKNKKNKNKENIIEDKKEENKYEIHYLSSKILFNYQSIDKKSNIYNIGAILYELIIGISPFYVTEINNNNIEHKLILPDFLSPELKDLLIKLLEEDVNKRIGVKNFNEIKEHMFFNNIDWDSISNKKIEPPLNLIKIKNDFEKNKGFKYKNKTNNNKENKNFNFNFIRTSSTNENEN